ncbi:hypothetical protein F2Q70_00042189 [Brassica cretica]|uniref:Uncharacterized protein n=1 Tax=Brassica cretica TaxID=69181 RepID=A0A8S9MK48_BRACR|nr:hypothetical protein F2Q70_00042189 [Brassica cretica]KAF2617403.1 hypothetical protein F2Q68_00042848 [Brassica cretica]
MVKITTKTASPVKNDSSDEMKEVADDDEMDKGMGSLSITSPLAAHVFRF